MVDIIVKSILEFVQQTAPDSILAGGSVRDMELNLETKDYDIFVPMTRGKEMSPIQAGLRKEFGLQTFVDKKVEYDESRTMREIVSVFGFEHEEKKFDIIGIDLSVEEHEVFAEKVIESFDFGINMAYHTGQYANFDNEKFRYDCDMGCASLHRLSDISGLPKSVARFNSLNERYKIRHGHDLTFRAPCLELKGRQDRPLKRSKYKYGGGNGLLGVGNAFNEPAPVQWAPNPVPVPGGIIHMEQAIDQIFDNNF